MLQLDPGTTRFIPFALFGDDAETAPLALAAPGVEIVATSWLVNPAVIVMESLALGTGSINITLPGNEPMRKRHWIDLRIHVSDGQSFIERVPFLVGWQQP